MNRGGMQLNEFQKEVEDYLIKSGDCAIHGTQPVDGLFLLRHLKPTPLEATLYEPVICLILQGQKEVCVGEAVVRVGPGESLVVTHDMDTVFTITDRLALVHDKRIAFVGTPDEAKQHELRFLREFVQGGRGTLNEDL